MPDWKSDAEYAFAKKLSRAGWAWEFMRRNPRYRADYGRIANARAHLPRAGHFFKGGKAFEIDRLARASGAHWGQLEAIADPANDRVPAFFLHAPVQPNGEQVDAFFCDPDSSGQFEQKPEFATLVFDVRRPLRQQIQRARVLLQCRQEAQPLIKPVRSAPIQWQLYLRVLDAKEAGASSGQVIVTIKAYKHLGNKADASYAAQDRISDHYKMARSLRDNPLRLFL